MDSKNDLKISMKLVYAGKEYYADISEKDVEEAVSLSSLRTLLEVQVATLVDLAQEGLHTHAE